MRETHLKLIPNVNNDFGHNLVSNFMKILIFLAVGGTSVVHAAR